MIQHKCPIQGDYTNKLWHFHTTQYTVVNFFTNSLLFTNIEPNPRCTVNENKLGSEQGMR